MNRRLSKVRHHLAISQPQMATTMGVSPRSWHSYESGKIEPPARMMRKLAELGVDIHWLVTGEGVMFRNEAEKTANVSTSEVRQTCRETYSQAKQAAAAQSLEELGLSNLVLASRGSQEGLWQLLQAVYGFPEGATFEEINVVLEKGGESIDRQSVALDLDLLTEHGLLACREERWVTEGKVCLKPSELADSLQVVRNTIQQLSQKILAACLRKDNTGFQVNVQIRCEPDSVKEKLELLRKSIFEKAEELEDMNGRASIWFSAGGVVDAK